MLRLTILTAALILASTEVARAAGPADGSHLILLYGLLSLFVTQIFLTWREERQRKADREREKRNRDWDLADRAAARLAQQAETVSTAVQLARVQREHKAEVVAKIDHNTELTKQAMAVSVEAYKAGNDFNRKLRVSEQMLDTLR